MRGSNIGEFEELVLMAVAILDGQAYGLAVREFLLEQTGRKVALGAIHATLYRLQDKDMLASDLEGATERRGGRRKRMFRLTSAGFESVNRAREVRERVWSLMPQKPLMPQKLNPGTAS
jgi:PadR family transcriptional regulator PadR